VRRVLFKLGFVKQRDNLKAIEQTARELSKEAKIAPLDLDCVLWFVGDERICGERKMFCEKCLLEEFCPSNV
jgi:endonuclease III